MIEEKLGYTFKNKALLETALTHSSYANEKHIESYERLEFLGDSILGFLAAEQQFLTEPAVSEGVMTKKRKDMVCEEALYECACELGLGTYLKISYGDEKTGGRRRVSVLADIVEALIAAIYLDSGMDSAKEFVLRCVLNRQRALADYKSALQEKVQTCGSACIEYEEISECGPDHDKTFYTKVSINGIEMGRGYGKTKQGAEQSAAKQALDTFQK